MAFWCDEFDGNKLSSKWVPARNSQGGQNNGQWTREVKDSKIYWTGVNGGTETSGWGEVLTLPVNAPGDIIIEAEVRNRHVTQTANTIGIGVNHLNTTARVRYGCEIYGISSTTRAFYGRNSFSQIPLPARPAQSRYDIPSIDGLAVLKIVRKNGYIFLYGNNTFLGSYAFTAVITDVIIGAWWWQANVNNQMFAHWIRIWPESVVM